MQIKHRNKRKKARKEYFRTKTSRKLAHQRNEHLGSPLCKILLAIFKIEKVGTQRNRSKDKIINNYA